MIEKLLATFVILFFLFVGAYFGCMHTGHCSVTITIDNPDK